MRVVASLLAHSPLRLGKASQHSSPTDDPTAASFWATETHNKDAFDTTPTDPLVGQWPIASPLLLTQPRFISPYLQTFRIYHRMLSVGDSYKVRGSRRVVFTMKSRLISLYQRKVLADRRGRPIAVLVSGSLSSLEIQAPYDDRVLAKVHKDRTQLKNVKAVAQLATGVQLIVTGLADSYQITLGGRPVAWVTKSGLLGDRRHLSDKLSLTVVPGTDSAFVVLLAILLDQMLSDSLVKPPVPFFD